MDFCSYSALLPSFYKMDLCLFGAQPCYPETLPPYPLPSSSPTLLVVHTS
uniref:Uncharacterized protein n=1 Tax=Nelumbo nucifera TaxID=4432 RepID=A0A822XLV2_NELNU|nr:TPA_asm: hypothetical protein HUJ06_022445 [Nelumbo nucifera]